MIDARLLSAGIGTYVLNVIASLSTEPNGFSVCALCLPEDAERMGRLCDEVRILNVPIYTLREQTAVPRAVGKANLLHVPHYNAPIFYRGMMVVTIHDLIHITDASFKWTPASVFYARPMLNLVARRADRIIADSEFTKEQIVERLGICPSKITVVYLGVSTHFCLHDREQAFSHVSSTLGVKWPYILFVGNLKPHKNLKTLIRAFALMRARKRLDHQLLVLGDDRKWKGELVSECQKLGTAEVVHFVPHVSYAMLPWIYGAADLLVLPSFLEGFGLPVLEAMACGTLVVCSRAASLPEVAGDAAEYFEPTSVEGLAAAMERVLGSPERQAELRRRGLERVGLFSWDECARRHCEVYRKVLQG